MGGGACSKCSSLCTRRIFSSDAALRMPVCRSSCCDGPRNPAILSCGSLGAAVYMLFYWSFFTHRREPLSLCAEHHLANRKSVTHLYTLLLAQRVTCVF